ncbi:MAG: chitobiase/beta-hexosaminidase C-terminal domain-containing protein, partial [Lewinella sp.]|nr:chitobiase/beta-hexosaminidase C-terminal domain-containing protein [Lewinella sp.]
GVAVSWMTFGLWFWLRKGYATGTLFQFGAMLTVAVLIFAGHKGGAITHGEDFVLAPVRHEQEEITENTPVYEALIRPVLQQKCFSCHNERKAKGGLVMTDPKRFRRGGDNGDPLELLDSTRALLTERLYLPLEEEEHMPPDGKPQLSKAEIDMIELWVKCGADMETSIGLLPPDHPLYTYVESAMKQTEKVAEHTYDFSPAAQDLIGSLNMPFRTVSPLAVGSPALRAAIFVREMYQAEFLEELLKIRKQLVELKLDHLPIKDEDLATIAQFEQLEVLLLNNTDISGDGLEKLTACRNLRILALSGTPVNNTIAKTLEQLPNLKELFVWDTALDTTAILDLKEKFPAIDIQAGFVPDENELLQLSPPAVKQDLNPDGKEVIILKHNFPGAVIRYTVDGSDPDSLGSEIYTEPIVPGQYSVIKARAFCAKWIGSETVSTTYFPRSTPILQAELLSNPNPKYRGSGAAGLIDEQKGFASNFLSPLWIGFREEPFVALFYPEDPALPLSTITLSYLQNMGSYIMAPEQVEVWAGNNPQQLRLVKSFRPEMPGDYLPNEVKGLDVHIPATADSCFKIVAQPIKKLPNWHQGKGDRAWIFFDEVYFYQNASGSIIPTD